MNRADYESLLAHCAGAGSPVPDALAGLSLARRGRVVSCGEAPAAPPLPPDAPPLRSAPNPYRLSQWVDAGDGWAATNDRLELDIHGAASMTHIDALSHFDQALPGDPMLDHPKPLEETPEWPILSEGLYPSFDLRKFELQVHAYCSQLRSEFSGHESGTIAELVGSVN